MKKILVYDDDKLLTRSLTAITGGDAKIELVTDERTAKYALRTEKYHSLVINSNSSKNVVYSKLKDVLQHTQNRTIPLLLLVTDRNYFLPSHSNASVIQKPIAPSEIYAEVEQLMSKTVENIAV